MNMMALSWGDTTIVIDAGVMFPDPDLLGVDLIIPDLTYLQQKGRVAALVLTHGHEDHIGGVPHVMPLVDGPVYGTPLTLALVEPKLEEHGIDDGDRLAAGAAARARHGRPVRASSSSASRTACRTASRWPSTRRSASIVHTGDFKIDQTPIDGEHFDLHRFAELGARRRAGAVRRQHEHRSPRLHRIGDRSHRRVRGDLHQHRRASSSSRRSPRASTACRSSSTSRRSSTARWRSSAAA